MSSQEINIHITGKDDASPVITGAMQKVTSSTNDAAAATKQATLSAKDAVVGFSGLAVSAFGLYTSFDRIEKSGVALDRANLMVQRSTQSLKSATDDYNKALASGDPTKIADATAKLSIAQDALTVSQERAKISQDNENESMASFALMIAPTAITALSSISKLSSGLPGLLSSVSSSIGNLSVSTKTLALSAGAAVGAFALGYTILNSLPEPMQRTAAIIAVVGGALAAAGIAAYAFWEGISLGAATPFILASLAAVGVAASGLTILMKSATSATNEYADANNNVTDSLQKVIDKEQTLSDAETTRYQGSLDANTTYWNDRLGLTESSLDKIDDKINSFYQKQVTDINNANQQTVDSVKSGYNQQLNDTNSFYDDMASATMAGLNGIRASRSKDLDTVELKYLFDKTALENAHDTGTILEEDYQQRIGDLNNTYNHDRNKISDNYRIQELEAENTQATALVAVEQGRANATALIQTNETDSLAQLEASKKALILGVNTELTDALTLARSMDEAAEVTHQDNLTTITKAGIDDRIKLNVDYINKYGNMTGGVVPDSLGNGSWVQTGDVPSQSAIADTSAASNFRDTISKENAVFLLAFQTGKITAGEYAEAIAYQKTRVPGFANGIEGITTGPMLALMGENGPERVSIQPLNKSTTDAVTNNFSVTINVEGSVDQRTLAVLKNELKNVVITATSSGAPNSSKRIRLGSNKF